MTFSDVRAWGFLAEAAVALLVVVMAVYGWFAAANWRELQDQKAGRT